MSDFATRVRDEGTGITATTKAAHDAGGVAALSAGLDGVLGVPDQQRGAHQ